MGDISHTHTYVHTHPYIHTHTRITCTNIHTHTHTHTYQDVEHLFRAFLYLLSNCNKSNKAGFSFISPLLMFVCVCVGVGVCFYLVVCYHNKNIHCNNNCLVRTWRPFSNWEIKRQPNLAVFDTDGGRIGGVGGGKELWTSILFSVFFLSFFFFFSLFSN